MAKSLTRNEKVLNAEKLYLETDMDQKDICAIVGWTEATFTKNKQKLGWEKLKLAETLSPQRLRAELYQEIFDLIKEKRAAKQNGDTGAAHNIGDQISKLNVVIQALSDNRITIPQHANSLKMFTIFLLKRDSGLGQRLTPYMKEFLQEVLNGEQ